MPWTADTLKPLAVELVPILEDFDTSGIKDAAKAISPEALQAVAGYKWNPNAKSALVSSGSAVAAKYLNRSGISAENAPEVSLGIALLSIYWGRTIIVKELEKLAEEKKREREKARDQEERNARRTDN